MRNSIKITVALILAVGTGVQAQNTDLGIDINNALPEFNNPQVESTAAGDEIAISQSPIEESVADPNAPVELIEEKFDDGSVKVRREVTLDTEGNYIRHGAWKAFSLTGAETATGEYRNDKREGTWTRTLTWGDAELLNSLPFTEFKEPFISKAEFKDGKLSGKWTITDSEGNVASDWNYANGQLDGTAKWFFPDGSLREEITYNDGLIDGTYKMWDQDGTELTNDTYQEGRKLAAKQDLYASGVVKWEGMFLHETYVIKKADDWWETQPVSYEKSGKPERHGRFTSWYENGQKKFEGIFENEIKSGEFTWWHENTQQAVQGSFKSDERHGVWSWWHENGQKAIQGQYDNGKLDGKWSYWTANGKLERKMDYTGDAEPVAVHSVPSTDIPSIADRRTQALPVITK